MHKSGKGGNPPEEAVSRLLELLRRVSMADAAVALAVAVEMSGMGALTMRDCMRMGPPLDAAVAFGPRDWFATADEMVSGVIRRICTLR